MKCAEFARPAQMSRMLCHLPETLCCDHEQIGTSTRVFSSIIHRYVKLASAMAQAGRVEIQNCLSQHHNIRWSDLIIPIKGTPKSMHYGADGDTQRAGLLINNMLQPKPY